MEKRRPETKVGGRQVSDTELFLILLAIAVVVVAVMVILWYYAYKCGKRRRQEHTKDSNNDYGRQDKPKDW